VVRVIAHAARSELPVAVLGFEKPAAEARCQLAVPMRVAHLQAADVALAESPLGLLIAVAAPQIPEPAVLAVGLCSQLAAEQLPGAYSPAELSVWRPEQPALLPVSEAAL
jgi:hypothetical protein